VRLDSMCPAGAWLAWAAASLALLTLLLSPAAAKAQTRYAAELGFDFSSGDYGSERTIDSLVLSLALGLYPTDRIDLLVTIPWLYQTEAITTTAGGIRLGGPGSQTTEEEAGGLPGRPFAAAIGDGQSANSQSGLGDITFSAGYVLLQETATRPMLRPNAFVKFPTAEEAMGTGHYDLGVGLDLSKWLAKWYVFGSSSVIFQGGKADLGLKDFATYEAGAGYPVNDRLLPVISLWGASSPADAVSSLLEARINLSYRLSDNQGISFTGSKGLSDSSPDYGLAGNLFFTF
jgi:hypothetical protein